MMNIIFYARFNMSQGGMLRIFTDENMSEAYTGGNLIIYATDNPSTEYAIPESGNVQVRELANKEVVIKTNDNKYYSDRFTLPNGNAQKIEVVLTRKMKYDQAGTYEIEYKAVDECGNETTATRTVEVVGDTSDTLVDTTNVTIPLYPDTNDYALASTVSNGDTIQLTLKGAMMEINDYTTFATDEIIKSWEIRNNEWFSYIPEIDQGGDPYHFYVGMAFDGDKVKIHYWCDNELMEKPTSFTADELIIERI